tara:strand:- start:851 stop:1813 length:963 start_codon:yes stop_codon:yes gene_type:complete
MVGGPNEPKHDIDYEFSKYVKHDLVFEFSNSTDQEIIDIGGQSYLDKRKEVENKILDANELKGGVVDESSKEEKTKPKRHVDAGFVVFKNVSDKMSRGIAKKAYTYGRRNNMDMIAISKYVEDAINSYGKMTPDMEESVKLIIEFKYPEETSTEKTTTPENSVDKAESQELDLGLFDIKKLNDIEDKMIRGSLKKIYMAGKRTNKSSLEIISDITKHLNDNSQMNDDLLNLLNSISSEYENVPSASKEINIEEPKETSLFEIKLLNSIEDKMIRGTAKKVYMSCKRSNKSSNETIEEIINHLKELDKLNDDIKTFLEGLK